MVHPFDNAKTKEFSNNLNQGQNDTRDIRSFLIASDDFSLDAGFNSGIDTEVSRVDSTYGGLLRGLIKS